MTWYLTGVLLIWVTFFFVIPCIDGLFHAKIESYFGMSFIKVGFYLGLLWPIILSTVVISFLFA